VSTVQLNVVNSTIREIMRTLDDVKSGRAGKERVLKLLDELENQIDVILAHLAPERITDERFNAAVKAVEDVSDKIRKVRESVVFGRYTYAKRQLLDVQESVRLMYRLLTLIKAGAPTPVIFQVAPQFLREISAPEAVVYTNPMAAQIYNVLIRKGEATVEELALELKITDETRDEFNRAISQLISMGYARPYFTPDHKMVLKPAR